MTDVFLSYSSADRAAAEVVQAALEANGISVFWDQDVPPGQDWDTWIRSRLTGSRIAVVLWSKTSIKSVNVRHEAMVARDAGKLVPAMIDELAAGDFPMGLYLVQGVKLTDWRDGASHGMARLVTEVQARLGKPGTPVTQPQTARPKRTALLIAAALALAGLGGVAVWYSVSARSPPGPGQQETASASHPPAGVAPDAVNQPPVPEATFATRMVGRWRWSDTQPCAEGPDIALADARLTFTTPDSRFVHLIEYDGVTETRSRVTEPESQLGHAYLFSPEFFATADPRSFNLVVLDETAGERNVWQPCSLAD